MKERGNRLKILREGTELFQAKFAELIKRDWNVGAYIAKANPGVKGFKRRGLYRMKQFYETYKDDEFVTPLVTQISWTNHLLILSGAKSAEERHFYMALCTKSIIPNCVNLQCLRKISRNKVLTGSEKKIVR